MWDKIKNKLYQKYTKFFGVKSWIFSFFIVIIGLVATGIMIWSLFTIVQYMVSHGSISLWVL
ncbi:hypothetical protein ACW95P_02610 [Candidatus Mycoplasma pogonae]